MWQCEFCNYTSIKKWNVQVHEKRKHSPKIENLNKEVKNNHINNKEIKIEDVPILYIYFYLMFMPNTLFIYLCFRFHSDNSLINSKSNPHSLPL